MKGVKFRLLKDGKIVGYEDHRYIEDPMTKEKSSIFIYHSRTGHEMSWKNISMNDNEKNYIKHDDKEPLEIR